MPDAIISQIRGPVLHGKVQRPFRVNEAVLIGPKRLLGEVIRIQQQSIVVQVYEDTSGLRPGDAVSGSGELLSVRLGPGLLGHIFDGLLRPLVVEQDVYIQPGMAQTPVRSFRFTPLVHAGQRLTPGVPFGRVHPPGGRAQPCLIPPDLQGEVVSIAVEGDYPEIQPLCTLLIQDGSSADVAMSHRWAVRRPRPVTRRLPVERPMLTGQRILDALFPLPRGGKAAMPGGFGTGKTILQESLAKWCDADVIVYVGCGERGNEMAGVLSELPRVEDPRSGRPLMERTVIIANTSNMPVAAREASIYTAVTVAEYFRDQGLHVALMADSTSRWAEALREVSGRLGELPAEAGFPAYLGSRQAEFYERAARVKTLAGDEASLTVIGTISPPAGDFSEPVTSHTKRYVRCFWALDQGRAQARFYPAIHPLISYSEDVLELTPWWQTQGNPQWGEQRQRFLTLLEEQARVERMARIVGKDALPSRQQLILLCAELINEGFLRQSAFSPVDSTCSPARQTAMMRLLIRFIDLAEKAITVGVAVDDIAVLPVVRRLRRMSEDISEDQLEQFTILERDVDAAFASLTEATDYEG